MYLSRIVDELLKFALDVSGAVLIEGPKWCGKTSTGMEHAKSILSLQDPDRSRGYLQAAEVQPSILLDGKKPRLIDEWQMAPVLWDAVRHSVDISQQTRQFILTGSAVPKDNAVMHTGTGRISRLLMRPMSLFESLDSSGQVSLKQLFNQEEVSGRNNLTVQEIAYLITRGGWPASIGVSERVALKRVRDYIDAVINFDVSNVDGISKRPDKVERLLRSLSRNIGTMANKNTLREDMLGDGDDISDNTITSYLNALKRIFVVEDLPAWNPALRSKTAIRTSSKRFFVDPSLAIATLGMSKEHLLDDFNLFGYMFEALCIRDLRIYAQAHDGKLSHYRDKSGLEADAIVHLRDGRWGAIEIKMGSSEIEKAAKNLKKLESKIDDSRMKSPSFLMILTCTEYAYKREDGIYIVPIGCLKH